MNTQQHRLIPPIGVLDARVNPIPPRSRTDVVELKAVRELGEGEEKTVRTLSTCNSELSKNAGSRAFRDANQATSNSMPVARVERGKTGKSSKGKFRLLRKKLAREDPDTLQE
jgi:hypothetical protein